MSDSLEVWTSHRDVSDVVRELAPFVDDTSVRLPAGRRIADGDWIRFSVHLLDGSKVFEGVGRCQESTQEGASTYRVRLSLLSFDERNEIMWERMLLAREDGAQATGNFDLRSLRDKILKPPPSAPSKSVPPPPPPSARVEPLRPPTLRPRPPTGRPPLPPKRPKPSTRPPPPGALPRPAPLPRPSSFPPPRASSFPPPRRPIDPAPLPKLGARPRRQQPPAASSPPPRAVEPPSPKLAPRPPSPRPEPEPEPKPEPAAESTPVQDIEPTPTRVAAVHPPAEVEATSTEIFSPSALEDEALAEDSGPRTEPPPPNTEAALAPTAERTSPAIVAPRAPSDDTSASHALSDQTHAALRLEVSARLVERARALAPNLPAGVLRVQPVRETPEEAVLRAALAIGLASLAALADSDDDP